MMRRRRGGLRGMGGDFYPTDQQLGIPGSGTDYDIPGSVSTSSTGGGSAGGGDYCIELSDGSSTCFSLWIVALVAGVGIFALAMMSGGGRRR